HLMTLTPPRYPPPSPIGMTIGHPPDDTDHRPDDCPAQPRTLASDSPLPTPGGPHASQAGHAGGSWRSALSTARDRRSAGGGAHPATGLRGTARTDRHPPG